MASRFFLTALLFGVTLAAPSPSSLKSDLTIVVDNDLQGNESPNADFGIVYLSHRQSYQDAVDSCKALGETLWKPSASDVTIDKALNLTGGDSKLWIASDGDKMQGLSSSGDVVSVSGDVKLPVLCTQSAPYSNNTFQDKDERWQVKIHANNEDLTGFRDHLSFRFFGIRYAPQPKRFTYPSMYKGSGGAVSALDYGSQCVQGGVNGSEDCLFLNIWTPYLPRSAKCAPQKLKPVMFWMHGGAYTGGTANDPTFDGANMASRGDVVIVNINYRLSTLGFLALDDGSTNGNYGFADQILALDWVRDNIRSFGGDPDRITIFGQSAGAGSVRAMMASPKAVGKFSGAIPMSNLGGLAYGTTYSDYYTIAEEQKVAADPILNATGCANATSPVDCLREVDANELVNLSTVARYLVVDGTYLVTSRLELDGPKAPYDLMMGIASQDGAPFITFPPNVTAQNTDWLTDQGLPYPPRDLYPLPSLKNQTLAVDRMGARLATDGIFRCVDQATVYAGLQNGLWEHVFYYEFERTYQTPGWPMLDLCEPPVTPGHPHGDPEAKIGYSNCHSGGLLYVWGNIRWNGLPYRDDENDKTFEKELLDRWTAFAWKRDPNVAGKMSWKPAVKGHLKLMLLDLPGEAMHGFKDLDQCKWLGLPIDYYL